MSENRIAIIYEGEKSEKRLFDNIQRCFFEKDAEVIPVCLPAAGNIYMLWSQLSEDDSQTDVIPILKRQSEKAKEILGDYKQSDFSEIYLFFDYDIHANNLGNKALSHEEVLKSMLELFSNETENGKLYINYPMIESIRDIETEEVCYRHCSIDSSESARYKSKVGELIRENPESMRYCQFSKYTPADWGYFCRNAIKKANCICNDCFELLDRKTILKELTQFNIFKMHQQKFALSGRIAVLSSVPLFLVEYFKKEFWRETTYVNDRG